ncbi:hypothetical protein A33Q_0592 [Indibacter alkaliphilus LW1]|uniref:Uncharacterized protein n=1 Tax=Indibacter alkaliphilus (strain CCUG 57479 / KCTC 22604 / LW1) TaxID=1189612 RepID=S2DJF7_INDAL|nr:hypothetical protein A33Q_0592 [Indibacter alkaliphilus LW1]
MDKDVVKKNLNTKGMAIMKNLLYEGYSIKLVSSAGSG